MMSVGRKLFNTEVLLVDPNVIIFDENADLPTIPPSPTFDNLQKAVQVLQTSSGPVAFPTETVYGLGASALDTDAVKGIYSAKNRPADNPLILHVSSVSQLERLLLPKGTHVPDIYLPLIEKFWPGPLTILLPVPKESNISPACTVGQSTFAVRIPSHPVARSLIALADIPLAAPSANASTRPSPTLASHVYTDLQGKIPLILDGGPCAVGVESTVIDGLVDPPLILRPGGVSIEEIKKFGGNSWQNVRVANAAKVKENEVVRTPGMKYKHYSPRAPVTLFINCGDGFDKVLKYLESLPSGRPKSLGLMRTRKFQTTLVGSLQKRGFAVHDLPLGIDGSDISRNLFAYFRQLDEAGVDLIVVEGIDETNEGLAVMNRLRKAATTVI
jgi:L-threonylcarbamoyladenylate synthase